MTNQGLYDDGTGMMPETMAMESCSLPGQADNSAASMMPRHDCIDLSVGALERSRRVVSMLQY